MPEKKRQKVVFRQDWRIGSAAAENDDEYLETCFVDTGAVDELKSHLSNKSILLGRVGAGKSALLRQVDKSSSTVRRINPQDFSLRYISNSNILQFVAALGIKLDPVFQALWKHVLCVELIRLRYNIRNKVDTKLYFQKVYSFVLNESRHQALEYFTEFGGSNFWDTTEVRVREITKKIEDGIEQSLKGKFSLAEATATTISKLSSSERTELVNNVKGFLNSIQMSALQEMISVLSEGDFSRTNNTYYIIIDDLDEQWAEDELRYRLIRALVEVVKRFREIRCVKILIAVRNDLLATVLNKTRDSGFQEEKFEDYFLRIRWSDHQLKQVINLRINELVKHKYTSRNVGFYDIFPKQVRKLDTQEYIIRRTLRRPRDVILFINHVFEEASGRSDISPSTVQAAERLYSEGRLNSLAVEWHAAYPQLKLHAEFLKGLTSRIEIESISMDKINQYLFRLYEFEKYAFDPVTTAGLNFLEKEGEARNTAHAMPFLQSLFSALYRVAAVGIKRPPSGRFMWNDQPDSAVLGEIIEPKCVVSIHPMLYGALGTQVLPESE